MATATQRPTPEGAERLEAQTVLWAAGVAASPLAASLGVALDRAGRVLAEPTLAVPGRPGDLRRRRYLRALQQDGRPLPGVAQVAKQEGAHAARNILRAVDGESSRPFRYRDYGNMATVGRGSAVADIGRLANLGLLRLAPLAVHPHLLADRLPQPPRRACRSGPGRTSPSSAGCASSREAGSRKAEHGPKTG